MKKLHYIYTVIFMFLFVGCEMESENLPTCHNDQLLFDFTTELSTYLDGKNHIIHNTLKHNI